MKVAREFTFDSAHFILDDKGSPCEEPHGHTYRLRIVVEGPVRPDGMVVDFTEIKRVVNEQVMPYVDHKDLNKLLKNPTAENIARWIYEALSDKFNIVSVRVWEGENKFAEI
jgi:6-pyruvoyltetrahydropterin/6-carboxytetrahydropterin synthase